jgi:hypothetical protein
MLYFAIQCAETPFRERFGAKPSTPVNCWSVTEGLWGQPKWGPTAKLVDWLAFAAQFGLCLSDFLKTEGAECRM